MTDVTGDLDRDDAEVAVPARTFTPVCPTSDTEPVRFTPADRRMRALLRVGDQIDPGALLGAQKAMSKSLAVSALRCTLTYLVIPILGGLIGLSDAFSAPLSIALCLFAGFMSIRSMRRFWIANHPKRWAYTAFASVVLVALTIGIITDVVRIVTR